jgi:NAD+ kinase
MASVPHDRGAPDGSHPGAPTSHLAPFTLDRSDGVPVGVLRTPDHGCVDQIGALRAWGRSVGVDIAELGTTADLDPAAPATQAIVALGGDGTILRALRHATPLGVPVLGVNFGHVGFLADVDRAGLPAALEAVGDGRATVEERSAITLVAPGTSAIAANDIALARRYGQGPARLTLTLAGTPLASLVGDGVLFASPGGSTAHNLNAGGPVLSPRLRALVLRTLSARAPMPGALVLHPDEPVTVRLAHRGPALAVEADGRVVGEIAPGAEVTVAVASSPARLLRTRPPEFFGELAERLARL